MVGGGGTFTLSLSLCPRKMVIISKRNNFTIKNPRKFYDNQTR